MDIGRQSSSSSAEAQIVLLSVEPQTESERRRCRWRCDTALPPTIYLSTFVPLPSMPSVLTRAVVDQDDAEVADADEIAELIRQVDAFKLSDEAVALPRRKRRFLIEKLIGLPRQWLSNIASRDSGGDGDN